MHKIEPAPTGRASCRGCKEPISKASPRFAEEFRSPYADGGGVSFRYWHLACAAKKLANETGEALARYDAAIDDRESIEALVREHARPDMPYAERAGSGRARCRACDTTIKKGELRVAFARVYESPTGPENGVAHAHPKCVARYLSREIQRGRESWDRADVVRRVLANSKLPQDEIDSVRETMSA
jgi:hypothetical protein